jgi:hypothetical protein
MTITSWPNYGNGEQMFESTWHVHVYFTIRFCIPTPMKWWRYENRSSPQQECSGLLCRFTWVIVPYNTGNVKMAASEIVSASFSLLDNGENVMLKVEKVTPELTQKSTDSGRSRNRKLVRDKSALEL